MKIWNVIAHVMTLSIGFGCQARSDLDDSLSAVREPLNVESDAIWTSGTIPVCWEPQSIDPTARRWAREAVTDTWQTEANIQFTGWGTCNDMTNSGLRVRMLDGQSATSGFGSQLNNVRDGVRVDNCQGCPSGVNRENEVRGNAIHEFGHALGFAHEEDRDDTPESVCLPQRDDGDTPVGPWDSDSAMYTCVEIIDRELELSAGDIAGVRTFYGDPVGQSPVFAFQRMNIDGGATGDDLLARRASGIFEVYLSTGIRHVWSRSFATPYSDASGWNEGHRFIVMDVNNDGRDDLLARNAFGNFDIWISNGSRLNFARAFATPYTDARGWNSGNRFFVMDFDNDSDDDLVARDAFGTFDVWLSNGSTLQYSTALLLPSYSDASGWNDGQRFFVLDNAFPATDRFVLRYANGTLLVLTPSGSNFTELGSLPTNLTDARAWNEGHRFWTMDMNDDGLGDLVTRHVDGDLTVWRSNMASFDTPSTRIPTPYSNGQGWKTGNRFFPMNIDGIGGDDVVFRFASGAHAVWLSNGSTLVYSGAYATGLNDAAGWNDGHRFF